MNGLKVDYDADSWLLGTPAIGNIDDDIDLEIVIGGFSSSMRKIFAINADGSDVSGYPLEIGERMYVGVALADFNSNGKDDIVVGTDSDNIHLFYDDGSEASGFPYQAGGNIRSAPAILDVDGQKVIFSGSDDNNLYAINSDGSLRFTVMATNKIYNSPAFIEHNNSMYIFFSDDSGILYGIDTEGNILPGWPVDVGSSIESSPSIADFNGDDIPEIVVSSSTNDLNVGWSKNHPVSPVAPVASSVRTKLSMLVYDDPEKSHDSEKSLSASKKPVPKIQLPRFPAGSNMPWMLFDSLVWFMALIGQGVLSGR